MRKVLAPKRRWIWSRTGYNLALLKYTSSHSLVLPFLFAHTPLLTRPGGRSGQERRHSPHGKGWLQHLGAETSTILEGSYLSSGKYIGKLPCKTSECSLHSFGIFFFFSPLAFVIKSVYLDLFTGARLRDPHNAIFEPIASQWHGSAGRSR